MPIENPGMFNTPRNIGIDRQNNVYVADRGNRRIQVFDRDGNFQRYTSDNEPGRVYKLMLDGKIPGRAKVASDGEK